MTSGGHAEAARWDEAGAAVISPPGLAGGPPAQPAANSAIIAVRRMRARQSRPHAEMPRMAQCTRATAHGAGACETPAPELALISTMRSPAHARCNIHGKLGE